MTHRHSAAAVLAFLLFGLFSAGAQDFDYAGEATSVIRQFMKLELSGGRITSDGWRALSNQFFLHPEPPPKDQSVSVLSHKYYVNLQTLAATGEATVTVSFPVFYGTIDPQLSLKLNCSDAPKGLDVLAGTSTSYRLVYSARRWELDPSWNKKESMGSLRTAMIAEFQSHLMLEIPAAIRYVTEMKNKASDPTIRSNADESLAELKKLQQ